MIALFSICQTRARLFPLLSDLRTCDHPPKALAPSVVETKTADNTNLHGSGCASRKVLMSKSSMSPWDLRELISWKLRRNGQSWRRTRLQATAVVPRWPLEGRGEKVWPSPWRPLCSVFESGGLGAQRHGSAVKQVLGSPPIFSSEIWTFPLPTTTLVVWRSLWRASVVRRIPR